MLQPSDQLDGLRGRHTSDHLRKRQRKSKVRSRCEFGGPIILLTVVIFSRHNFRIEYKFSFRGQLR